MGMLIGLVILLVASISVIQIGGAVVVIAGTVLGFPTAIIAKICFERQSFFGEVEDFCGAVNACFGSLAAILFVALTAQNPPVGWEEWLLLGSACGILGALIGHILSPLALASLFILEDRDFAIASVIVAGVWIGVAWMAKLVFT